MKIKTRDYIPRVFTQPHGYFEVMTAAQITAHDVSAKDLDP